MDESKKFQAKMMYHYLDSINPHGAPRRRMRILPWVLGISITALSIASLAYGR